MRKLRIMLTSLLLTAALMVGSMPAVVETAFAADDHSGWETVSKLFNMWNEDENGMAVVETIFDEANYYLANNLTLDRPLLVKSGTNVTICLHGHDLVIPSNKDSKYLFYVEEGATLTIENCTTDGNVQNNNSSCYAAIYNEGEVNISGCAVGSSNYAIQTENGTVRISGEAKVSSGYDAIKMSGGNLEISGSSEISGLSCGIVMDGGNLTVSNASISGTVGIKLQNTASANILNGTDIKGTQYGVHALGKSKLQFSGGEIHATGTDAKSIDSKNSKISIFADFMSMPCLTGPIGGNVEDYIITAGHFSHTPKDYLTSAYKVIDSGNSECPYAVIEKEKYTVTFTNGEGKTIDTQSVHEGCAATPPVDPKRSGYTFNGWDKDFSNITADLKVNALWKAETKKDLPAVKIAKPASQKKAVTVKWKKISKKSLKKIKKVEIQYSLDKKFKKGVKTKYASAKKTALKIKGLKSKKTYYVRLRGYTKSGGIIHISKWSSVKKVKAK